MICRFRSNFQLPPQNGDTVRRISEMNPLLQHHYDGLGDVVKSNYCVMAVDIYFVLHAMMTLMESDL